ncbi:hypothetical protein [Shewanella fidelis]|uniref:Uncharacterized protein n=1 Tax=Shewanella fidelis TaxID=173509 RepID=A0AAW8NUE7_9GAMM|nr:hypothetical protein [Shewanella fidelis]MDR8526140.1 hypothetical protein [Shewanella fidelis]MDW4813753.1 hypothetical protein [Shewanella fidelis]MDW4817849.1 hypothetical protein [Shewanella fidelis]MDW4821890.1 hypothetical protein [Shewanella fidelis]MDW4826081.1 hypothetical protein [Shewanella fidelis]
MSKRYRWVITLVSLSLLISLAAFALPLSLSLKPFSKGNYLVKKGAYDQAAAHWHQLSIQFMSNSQNLSPQQMWQNAGLAASLAAIAADKAQDPIAYQYWADSTRYLLTGGTNWSQLQQQLHQRFETANTQLSVAMQVNDINAAIDASLDLELSVLQVWDDKLAIFEFSSPRLGLNRLQQNSNVTTSVAPPYPAEKQQNTQHNGEKKLSGIQTNVSQTPAFTLAPVPTTDSTATEQTAPTQATVDSSATEISAAAQHNPLAKGNLVPAQNPQVEAKQKRQIEPVPASEQTAPTEAQQTPAQKPEP